MSIATLKLDTSTKLSFAVAITGASGTPVTRFIIEDKNFSICYLCTQTNEGSEVEISGLQNILKAGDYKARLEIVLENKLYVPLRDTITFEPTVEIVTRTLPTEVKESVLVSGVTVNVKRPIINENLLRKTHAANIIAQALHYSPTEKESAQQTIEHAIERSAPMTQTQLDTLQEMLKLAESVGLSYQDYLLPSLIQEEILEQVKPEVEDEESDSDVDDMIKDITTWDSIIEVYDLKELSIVDKTGEVVNLENDLKESEFNGVLSRAELIRSKIKSYNSAGPDRGTSKLVVISPSSNASINKKSLKLATKILELQLTRGKLLESVSTNEKIRISRIIQNKSKLISRIALKLTSRIKFIEKTELL